MVKAKKGDSPGREEEEEGDFREKGKEETLGQKEPFQCQFDKVSWKKKKKYIEYL